MKEQPEYYDGSSPGYCTYDAPASPAPQHYARPQPPAWSPQTVAYLDRRLREQRAAQHARELAAAEQRLAEAYARQEAAEYALAQHDLDTYCLKSRVAVNCWGQQQYADLGQNDVPAPRHDPSEPMATIAERRAEQTEKEQALLDLAKDEEAKNPGKTWEEYVGLAREKLAVLATKNR